MMPESQNPRLKPVHFETTIAAPRDVVWDTMLQDETYRAWASEFMEGSYYDGGWGAGDRIRFLGPEGSGISSEIAESRRPEFVSIRHLGMVDKGVEDTTSDEVRSWAPSYETYTLDVSGDGTRVVIDLDIPPEWASMMEETWPRALAKLKSLCETQSRAAAAE